MQSRLVAENQWPSSCTSASVPRTPSKPIFVAHPLCANTGWITAFPVAGPSWALEHVIVDNPQIETLAQLPFDIYRLVSRKIRSEDGQTSQPRGPSRCGLQRRAKRAVQYFKHHGISASPEDEIIEASFRSRRELEQLVVGDKETGPASNSCFSCARNSNSCTGRFRPHPPLRWRTVLA